MGPVLIKNPDVVFRRIGEESVLVPVADNVGDLSCIYTLNETGSRIWELLDGKRDICEVCEVIVEEYDVPPEEAKADTTEFIEDMIRIKFLGNA